MRRVIRRIAIWMYQVFVFGIFVYIVATPWIREFSIDVFAALPNYPLLIVTAALLTFVDLAVIVFVIRRKPWPYALSLMTLWNTWRKRREVGCSWKSAFLLLDDRKDFYEFNAPFAALSIPYLRMLFIPLIFMSIPFLASIEEFIFRDGKDTLLAILIWSALFALAHILSGFRVMDLAMSFGIGVLLAIFYLQGGLAQAIVLHTAINIFGVAVLIWLKVFWPDIKPRVASRAWYTRLSRAIASERIRPQMPEYLKGGES